ncbi:MAG: hypothetical protein U1F43_23425 [Myxococcota bacterium]
MRIHPAWLALTSLTLASSACGDDKKTTDTSTADADTSTGDVADTTGDDADTVTPPAEPFAFGLKLGQAFSDGPFPSDIVRDADGFVDIAPLAEDARMKTLAKSDILTRTATQLAKRKGFGFESAVFFPMNEEPDLASFEGKVHYVAIDGPEEGKVFGAQVFWFAPGSYLGVMPDWGQYLVPGSKYAVFIDIGVKTKAGASIAAHPDFAAVMSAEPPSDPSADLSRARIAFAGLREFVATRDQAVIMGTEFTTEDALGYLQNLVNAADNFLLVAPTRGVRSTTTDTLTWENAVDVHGASDLADYFGVASDAFAFQPGGWGPGNRDAAKAFTSDSQPYKGGTFAGEIGWVINGSIVAPSYNLAHAADGSVTSAPIEYDQTQAPVVRSKVAVPFSLFLCKSHVDGDALTTAPVKIAIFTHGGTALRSDALAFANINCTKGIATISMDMPFHGGRQAVRYFASEDLVVPTQADAVNTYKDASAGGRTSDYIGDNGGATVTVGGFFALDKNLDPEIIEANHLAVAVETRTLVRYLKDEGAGGLGPALGLTFDTSALVHESLSFGTSFGTAFLATSDDVAAAVISVGSGMMVSANLPMAPNNANLASNLFVSVMGLKSTVPDIVRGAYKDPMVAMVQYLSQRGDPLAYAPFVLRHRVGTHELHVIGFGDSWDETLFTPAQISFANAWGVPVFTSAGWNIDASVPGASAVESTAFAATSDNLTVDGRTQTAGYFYLDDACHAEVVVPLCESNYQPPYPPPTPRAATRVFASPVCAIHKAVQSFLTGVVAGESPTLSAPPDPGAANTDCADIYD